MATEYYAWSPFRYGMETDGKGNFLKHKELKIGDVVTQDKIKATDEEWDYLKRTGAVRKDKHPEMGSFTGSPVEFFREQARRASNNELVPDMDEAGEDVEEEPKS